MTLFELFWPSEKNKKRWLVEREAKLKEEFRPQLEEISLRIETTEKTIKDRLDSLKQREIELEACERRMLDRRLELEKSNKELLDQIRIIEAKASPSAVWESAFTAGFEKAFDTVWSLQTSAVEKVIESVKNKAINATLQRLNGHPL